MHFLIRVLVNAVALFVATQVIPGIHLGEGAVRFDQNFIVQFLVLAIIFGLVNAIIKPLVATLTCGLYLVTLGLFTFVVNALMLMLTSYIAVLVGIPFHVDDFIAALLGSIVISIVSFVLSALLGGETRRRERTA